MDDKAKFELLKDLSLSDGGKLLLDDIRINKDTSDTIFVLPLIDNGMVISPIADEMLKRQGYVQALNWMMGILEHYQTAEYEELDEI
jgi:hypothetical protein